MKLTTLRLPREMFESLKEIAENEDRSVAYIIRRAINDHIKKKINPKEGKGTI